MRFEPDQPKLSTGDILIYGTFRAQFLSEVSSDRRITHRLPITMPTFPGFLLQSVCDLSSLHLRVQCCCFLLFSFPGLVVWHDWPQIGGKFVPVSFSVLDQNSVDMLLGLDMLRRHQAVLDLRQNRLEIADTSVTFLSEAEIPTSDTAADNQGSSSGQM